jgi:hypothetical protein
MNVSTTPRHATFSLAIRRMKDSIRHLIWLALTDPLGANQ